MRVEIYSRPGCGYCENAKDIFKQKGVHFVEYSIGSGFSREAFFEKFPNEKTVPQIVIDGEHIGGYTQLTEWMKEHDTGNLHS